MMWHTFLLRERESGGELGQIVSRLDICARSTPKQVCAAPIVASPIPGGTKSDPVQTHISHSHPPTSASLYKFAQRPISAYDFKNRLPPAFPFFIPLLALLTVNWQLSFNLSPFPNQFALWPISIPSVPMYLERANLFKKTTSSSRVYCGWKFNISLKRLTVWWLQQALGRPQ